MYASRTSSKARFADSLINLNNNNGDDGISSTTTTDTRNNVSTSRNNSPLFPQREQTVHNKDFGAETLSLSQYNNAADLNQNRNVQNNVADIALNRNVVNNEETHNTNNSIVHNLIVDEVDPPTNSNNMSKVIERWFCNKAFKIDTSNKRSRCVVNLSTRPLTETETNVLAKGLKFCPTPGEPDMYNIHQDLREFFRRMRLRAFFYDDSPTPPSQNTITNYFSQDNEKSGEINLKKFKPKSEWEPPLQYRDPVVETFCKTIQDEVSRFKPREPRYKNITLDEKNAIKALSTDPTIVIKKADKGSAIVVMNKHDYITEAERQLNNTDFYQKTPEDLTLKHVGEIRDFLITMKENGEIDQKTFDTLDPTGARTPSFYFLPKIHKKEIKGRPIISGNGSPTEKISALVDELLKDYVKQIPSYVRDTSDFIQKVEAFTHPSDYFLVTMDVSSLYTNIPNHEGITSVRRTLIEKGYDGQVSIESLTRLLTLVLHMNNFEFNNSTYLQIGGTSMGTRVAPSLANIFMSKLEEKLLRNAPHKPALYLRYIDDIFMVFTGSETQLLEFIEHMNNGHHSIKFTAEYSKDKVPFLDTWVKKSDQGGLFTDLYTKPTDTQNYLHYTSCHPTHCKNGAPYGEFLRIRRNCSNIEDYQKQAKKRIADYLYRGYPENLLNEAYNKALNQNRTDLLNKTGQKSKKQNDRVPLVLTFNPANPNLVQIVQKHWGIMQLSSKAPAFTEPPMVVYRRNTNLSDKLVRAKLKTHTPTNNNTGYNNPCRATRAFCHICPKNDQSLQYTSSYTGRHYTGVKYTCETRNVVYLLTCRKCKKQYVGQTYRTYKTRINEHYGYIKRKDLNTASGRHFSQPGHSKFDMNHRVIAILKGACFRNNPKLLQLEERLIERLRTMEPIGLNDKNSQRV